MKDKYSKSLILNYLNGDDLEGYDVDALENDYEFMIQAMRISKDKNLYNLCSDEIRNNYKFVTFIVNDFDCDKDFICMVADNYLNNSNDDILCKELQVIMASKFNGTYDIDYAKYGMQSLALYQLWSIEMASIYGENKDNIDNVGLGFITIMDMYATSDILKRYFASHLIDRIFYIDKEHSLEERIHKFFKKSDNLKNFGISKYIIEYIKYFDSCLADFVCSNIDLIEYIIKDIENIVINWDNYMNKINFLRISIIEDEITKFQREYDLQIINFDCEEIVNKICKSLNIPEIFNDAGNDFEKFDSDGTVDILEGIYKNRMAMLIKDLYKEDLIENDTNEKIRSYKSQILYYKG